MKLIINKIARLVLAGLFAFSLVQCTGPEKNDIQKPNILFIAVDDLRPELGCYGNDIIKTPVLDKLAEEGFVFKNHFVQVPTCGASRYALLTGMRPSKTDHIGNQAIVKELSDKAESEIPESFIHHLRRNGYYTVGIGKISHYADGLVYGYTDSVSQKRELPHSWDEMLFNNGKWGTGWNAFFGYADGGNRQGKNRQVKPYEAGEVDDDGYPDGLTLELAISKLRELKDKNQPFFLGVGFFKPHLPFTAPKKYWDLYDRADIPLSPNPFIPENVSPKSLHGSGEFNGYQLTDEKAGLSGPVSEEYARKLRHAYFACVSYIDTQIGKILKEVETLGLEENTIVVVWGDHGWHLGDQLVWGKHTVFERAVKSALILRVPGSKSNPDVQSIVETVDIYPTLMELCNVETAYQTDGQSFVDLLKDSAIEKEDVAYSYYRKGISLRTNRYRLTKYFRAEEPAIELYDHSTDPNETKNIAFEKPEVVRELMPLLDKGDKGIWK